MSLEELNFLSILNKIQQEIENHLGISDLVLVEFLVKKAKKSSTQAQYLKKIKKINPEFPDVLVESIFRLVKNMTNGEESGGWTEKDRPDPEKFSGLAVKDDRQRIDDMMKEELREREKELELKEYMKSMDTGAGFDDGDDSKEKSQSDRYKADRHKENDRHDRDSKKRMRNRSRSRSPERHSRRNRSRSPENSRRDRSRSPRDYSRRRRSRSRSEDRSKRSTKSRKETLDATAILNKVYKGTVTGIKDFGVFVSLQNIKAKSEGLVHISNILPSRVNHPSDVVRRGDQVYVKVVTLEEGEKLKIGLSMKLVDQTTGDEITEARNPDRPAGSMTGN